jgi:Pyridoxal-dependent decarboxylase, pyridoxal binding domain
MCPTIAIDGPAELGSVVELLGGAHGCPRVRVVLRHKPRGEESSRFGMDGREVRAALSVLADAGRGVVLEGFSVHLSGYDPTARAEAGVELVDLCLEASARGFKPWMIDLGGGWPISYTAEDDWLRLRQFGVLLGGSAGGVLYATVEQLRHLEGAGTMVALAGDGGEKYLDTIFDETWMRSTGLLDRGVEADLASVLRPAGEIKGHVDVALSASVYGRSGSQRP